MTHQSALRALARRAGVLDRYRVTTGRLRFTSDDTRVALLAAMGMDASDAAAARRSLDALNIHHRERLLPPVQVVAPRGRPRLAVNLPSGRTGGAFGYRIELITEQGERLVREDAARAPRSMHAVTLPCPRIATPGYHVVRLTLDPGGSARAAEQLVLAAPRSCTTVREVLGNRRVFGLMANLYTMRSDRDWGAGDMAELRALVAWARVIGAAFVGINPLHATRNTGDAISPYRPISRLIRNPLYLDITAIPELAHSEEARALLGSSRLQQDILRLRNASHVDYEAVMRLKHPVLEALYRAFVTAHGAGGTARARAYRSYCDTRDPILTRIATFLALDAHFRSQGRREVRSWPNGFRDPSSREVVAFAASNAVAVDFQRYLQFELDRQLGDAQGETAGRLPIGVFGDLALGSDPDGADPWAFPGLFVSGAHLGAPPDAFITLGQDWGLPPLHPERLLDQRLEYWIAVVRHALGHSDALRIDHVMGLFRQFWIPDGGTPAQGAYVRYPAQALLAVLAIESRRRRALVIGEDLGTVPRGLPAMLARWGILSTRVLYFERDGRGGFQPSRRYSRRALITANTHDMIPLAGFWVGRDLEIRRRLGLISSGPVLQRARRIRERERAALHTRLVREKCLAPDAPPPTPPDLCAAVHCMLARTPAPLVGASLDDLAGEREPVNLPGVSTDRYASWTRRLGLPLETLRDTPAAQRVLRSLGVRRWRA